MRASIKWITISAIALGCGAYIMYDEVMKLLKYAVSMKSAKVRALDINNLVIDLWFNFKNPSNLNITLSSVRYDVYVDGVYATTLENNAITRIEKNATSVIGMQMVVNPRQFFSNLPNPALALLEFKNLPIRLDMKFKVKVGFVNIPVPYVYEGKMKEFM